MSRFPATTYQPQTSYYSLALEASKHNSSSAVSYLSRYNCSAKTCVENVPRCMSHAVGGQFATTITNLETMSRKCRLAIGALSVPVNAPVRCCSCRRNSCGTISIASTPDMNISRHDHEDEDVLLREDRFCSAER